MFVLYHRTRPLANLVRGVLRLPIFSAATRYKIARGLFRPEHQISYEFQVPFHGTTYHGFASDFVDWQVFFLGTHEAPVLYVFDSICRKLDKPVFLDIGANKGIYSVTLAALCSQVHAFEPFPRFAAVVKRRLEANKIKNVTVHEIALGSANADLEYFAPATNNQGTGSFVSGHSEEGTNLTTPVTLPVRVGSEVLEKIGLQGFDVAKIDTEGFEPHVIMGLKDVIASSHPFILFEFSESSKTDVKTADDFRAMFPESYEFYEVTGEIGARTSSPRPLVKTTCENIYKSDYGNYLAVDQARRSVIEGMIKH